jgi:hypothetical protein
MRARVAVMVTLIAAATATARAEPTSVRLSYTLGRGADECPSEHALREAIADQLGYYPFSDEGDSLIAVSVRHAGGELRARIELSDNDGRRVGARELSAASCDELASAIELAVGLAIDALANARARFEKAQAPPASPPPAQQQQPPPQASDAELAPLVVKTPARVRPRRVHLRVSVGALSSVDAHPAPAAGITAQLELLVGRFGVGLELRGDPPASASFGSHDSYATALVMVSLIPCLRHRMVAVCALASVGGERISSTLGAATTWQPWAALGGRLALEFPLWRLLELRLFVDVALPVVRDQLTVGAPGPTIVVYATPAITSAFGGMLMARFP